MDSILRPQLSWSLFFYATTYFLFVPLVSHASADDSLEPEIQELVDSGLRYLEKHVGEKPYGATGKANKPGSGEPVLWGYAHLKAAHDPENPVVKAGLRAALAIVGNIGKEDAEEKHSASVYNAGITAMFLAELDKIAYSKELEKLSRYLSAAQFKGGGFGYYGWPTGDLSQAQYAMLALWTMDRSGVPIDYQAVVRASDWLGRVQDVGGGWPYQGTDPSGANGPIAQAGVTVSMALAGGSARLIAGDILYLWGEGKSEGGNNIPGLPKAIRLPGGDNSGIARPEIPAQPILKSIDKCQAYLAKNSVNPEISMPNWPYYQLYTLERYESFREVAFGLEKDPNPAWFRMGVDYIKKHRTANGALASTPGLTPSGQTAFAILFLIRSTQKTIAQVSTGAMAGGWGIPKDTTKITVNGTQIKGEPEVKAVNDLLSLLEADDKADKADSNSIAEDIKLATDPAARRVQIDRFERLVRGSKSWQARRVAARLLGTSDQLSVVPALIFAISDNDKPTRRYAINGLQFISRKFDIYDLPDDADSAMIRDCQKKWIAWYQTMYPDFVYIEDGF